MVENVGAAYLVVEQVEAECRLRLRLTIKLSLKGPDLLGCFEAHGQPPPPRRLRKRTRSQGPSLRRSYPGSALLCPCPTPARSAAISDVEAATSDRMGLPRYPHHLSGVPCPLPRRIETGACVDCFPAHAPSPFCRRVGIRTSTFEACSGFTHVTARRIAQPPKAAFVTRLRSSRSPDQTARQLPEQSTTLWVDPPSTGETRHRGAGLHSKTTKPLPPESNGGQDSFQNKDRMRAILPGKAISR